MKKMIKKTSALAISAFMLAQYIPFSAVAYDNTHTDLYIYPYSVTDAIKKGLASPTDDPTGTSADATRAGQNGTAITSGDVVKFDITQVDKDGKVLSGGATATNVNPTVKTTLPDGYYLIKPKMASTDANFQDAESFIIQLPVANGATNNREVYIYPKLTDNNDNKTNNDTNNPTQDFHTLQLTKTLSDGTAMSSSVKATFDAYYKNATDVWTKAGTYYTDQYGKLTIDGLPLGKYYLVETAVPTVSGKEYMLDSTPIEFNIDGVNPATASRVNQEILSVTKEIANDGAGVGKYNWTITGSVPTEPTDIPKISDYKIIDTYAGVTITGVSVNISGITQIDDNAAFDPTVKQFKAVDNGTDTLTITFSQAAINAFPTTGVVVTVNSTLNANVASATNSAEVQYKFGATDTSPVISPTPQPTSYPTGADKIDDDDTVTPATLIISNHGSGELEGASYEITDASDISFATPITATDSASNNPADTAVVANLAPGHYFVHQTGVGAGYVKSDEVIEIFVGKNGTIYKDSGLSQEFDTHNTVVFANTADGGFALPFTGTTATIVFSITGILLMAGTAFFIFIILKKRDDDEEEQENN